MFRLPTGGSRAASFTLALTATAFSFAATAQDTKPAAPAAGASAPATAASGGGFAERLVPKLKKAGSAAAVPYTPIKPPVDDGLIPEIEMFVGESRVFPAPGVARIAVGNGGIMSAAALDSKEVILFANGVGTSSLFIWNEDGRYQRVKINIVPGDTSRIAREIAAFLTAIPNAKASVVGDKVIVEGDNLSDGDLLKISKLAERYPQILNFTNTVGWEQMVMLDVKVVEFPTSVLREIGLKWHPTGGAAVGALWSPLHRGNNSPYQIEIRTGTENAPPITAASGSGPVPLQSGMNILSAINLGLNAQLNLLAQDGQAAILAEPQLSARNGSSASFLAGGEIPYSVSNANGTTISFKPYGIKLDIEPRVDRNGVIRAKIEAEVSAVDASVTSTIAGPALTTRRTKTEFNVHAGETFVLSGLLQRSVSTDIDKVPLLGDIPILGALFRSKRFQNKETELVVFVTPRVVSAGAPGNEEQVQKTHERLRKELADKPYLVDPVQARQEALTKPAPLAAQVPAAEPPAANAMVSAGGSTLQVRRDGLVLHTQPSSRSTPLMQLGVGAFVQLGRSQLRQVGSVVWRNVVVGDMNGWVLAEGVVPAALGRAAVGESAYAEPDQSGKRVALQPPVAGGDARAGGLTLSDAAAEGSAPTYRVALYKLALRVTPDINAPVLLQLAQGDIVKRLPEPAKGYWIAVEAKGQKGWVASQWLDPVSGAAPQAH